MADDVAMPPFARAFRMILWGSIFMVFDLELDGFDVFPDVIGHVLMGMGCIAGLAHLGDLPAVGRAAAWILTGAMVLALSGDVLELVAPEQAQRFHGMMTLRSEFALLAFVVLGRAVAGAWLPRYARRWQFSLVMLLMLDGINLLTWLAGLAMDAGWQSPGFGFAAAPVILGVIALGLAWVLVTAYAVFSTLPALKRVRTTELHGMAPLA